MLDILLHYKCLWMYLFSFFKNCKKPFNFKETVLSFINSARLNDVTVSCH